LQKLAAQVAFNPAARDSALHAAIFRKLVGFVLIALRTYIEHVRQLRSYLDTQTFRCQLQAVGQSGSNLSIDTKVKATTMPKGVRYSASQKVPI
jgi:hypothetical protein